MWDSVFAEMVPPEERRKKTKLLFISLKIGFQFSLPSCVFTWCYPPGLTLKQKHQSVHNWIDEEILLRVSKMRSTSKFGVKQYISILSFWMWAIFSILSLLFRLNCKAVYIFIETQIPVYCFRFITKRRDDRSSRNGFMTHKWNIIESSAKPPHHTFRHRVPSTFVAQNLLQQMKIHMHAQCAWCVQLFAIHITEWTIGRRVCIIARTLTQPNMRARWKTILWMKTVTSELQFFLSMNL